ncbi:M15 family metallopeptidase [Hymenobacter metallilatus]|uniref:D-alanyl-D-alanine dipeptidase n=1 Tax=Hymenobacter metallilatus TaxID=2493666 RepID=A0A428JRP3_9BACT|nr:M15 family metallopeptidase [Hymenobacter metallilatus]RSK36234.1 D-alanyl-D-alanine dipeptidase [Hymenobacter metallilatus]
MAVNSFGVTVISSLHEYRQRVAHNPERELVELITLIPDLVLDIRYATARNLLGKPLYKQARAFLRRPVAEALRQVQQALRRLGLGLCVYDAYRPYTVTVQFFEHVRDEKFAAPPWRGSRHNRGCSVDVGLVEQASGRPLPLPTDFDELLPATDSRYSQLPPHVLFNRSILLAAMKLHGFVNYSGEWWHFDHPSWADFDLLDLSFEELSQAG